MSKTMTTMPEFVAENAWDKPTELLTELLDRTMKTSGDAEPVREYLGASMMGRECAREVAYAWHKTTKDEGRGFTGRIYRIFDFGHRLEDAVADYLRLAGFDLRTHKPDGSQYGFEVADGRIQGHIDGVFVGGPSIPGMSFPALWESKSINDKGFKQLKAKGVRATKPVYWAQCQTLMAYMELDACLFTAINKNDSEVFAEVIPLDVSAAQHISDRAVKIVQSNNAEEFPRIAANSTDFRCRFCDFHDRCWSVGANNSPTTVAPSWLTNGAKP